MDGRTFAEQMDTMARDAIQEIAFEMEDDLREILSEQHPPASAPGTPPHRRSGQLQNAVYSEVEEFVDSGPAARVGVDPSRAPHAEYLAQGTGKMDARPWVPALQEKWTPEHYAARMQAAFDSYSRSQEKW